MAEPRDTQNQRSSHTAGMNARSDKDGSRPLSTAAVAGARAHGLGSDVVQGVQGDHGLDRYLRGSTLTAGPSDLGGSTSSAAGNTILGSGGLSEMGDSLASASSARRVNVSSGEDTTLSNLPSSDSSMRGSEAFQRQGQTGEASDRDDVVDVLNDLVECCRDGEYGFHLCAEHVQNTELKQRLGEHADECRSAARELMDCIRQLGGEADDGGSAMGSVHRGWVSLKGTLAGYSDKAMLKEAERGQDTARAHYRKALKEKLPPEVRSLVQRQADGAQRKRDEMKAWRERG